MYRVTFGTGWTYSVGNETTKYPAGTTAVLDKEALAALQSIEGRNDTIEPIAEVSAAETSAASKPATKADKSDQ